MEVLGEAEPDEEWDHDPDFTGQGSMPAFALTEFAVLRSFADRQGVTGLVDQAHPAFAELLRDLMMTQRLADHGSAPSLLSDGACHPQE
jgi:hypothetical protein